MSYRHFPFTDIIGLFLKEIKFVKQNFTKTPSFSLVLWYTEYIRLDRLPAGSLMENRSLIKGGTKF